MHASLDGRGSRDDSPTLEPSSPSEDVTNMGDEERGLPRHQAQAVPLSVRSRGSNSPDDDETELRTRPNSAASSSGNFIKRKTSQFLEAVSLSSSNKKTSNAPLAPKLAALIDAYAESSIARQIKEEGEALRRASAGVDGNGGAGTGELPDVAVETSLLRGRKRASYGTQFRILSGRAFKNLYRDPALLMAHYLSSIALACKMSFSFSRITVTHNISAIQ